ncbi:hypothetical protein BD289DRAFT_297465 [Coniella lustricola]|uniref:Transmembrane protein n=1 Tax=Coniella lustricola TaxID=2025994 RepID=A0A2T3A4T9_9PEZI|nr:hypothetical protein BD289DRAFT_297465 [Coniella lustricola]
MDSTGRTQRPPPLFFNSFISILLAILLFTQPSAVALALPQNPDGSPSINDGIPYSDSNGDDNDNGNGNAGSSHTGSGGGSGSGSGGGTLSSNNLLGNQPATVQLGAGFVVGCVMGVALYVIGRMCYATSRRNMMTSRRQLERERRMAERDLERGRRASQMVAVV